MAALASRSVSRRHRLAESQTRVYKAFPLPSTSCLSFLLSFFILTLSEAFKIKSLEAYLGRPALHTRGAGQGALLFGVVSGLIFDCHALVFIVCLCLSGAMRKTALFRESLFLPLELC